tara:strand:- start:4 stop:135 length:132 start_codon:yes stop_codon:yes gene_type:complete
MALLYSWNNHVSAGYPNLDRDPDVFFRLAVFGISTSYLVFAVV